MIYLDHNATTPPTPGVIDASARMLTEHWHNPSSAHRAGQAARREVELARERVARLLGCTPAELVFTGTATESIDLAIRGAFRAMRGAPGEAGPVLVTSAVEHEAVRMLAEDLGRYGDIEVRTLPVDRAGRVDPAELDAVLGDAAAARRGVVVSIQWANNETGVVQRIGDVGDVCRAHGAVFHCDATQWVGKHPVDLGGGASSGGGVDLLTLAGHKLHGPKGVGVLFIRRGVRIEPTLRGVQELERRGGTENAPAIAGLGAAADEARAWTSDPAQIERLTAMRDGLESRLLGAIEGAEVHGVAPGRVEAPSPGRLCNTISVGIPGVEAEGLVLALSERGVCVSAGAACASGSMEPSPVLEAMGAPDDLAEGTIRLSLSRLSTQDEVDRGAEAVIECVRGLRG